MDKYVHIEYLKDYLNRQIQAFEPCPDKYDAAVEIYNCLYQIPAADVAPVIHAHWINLGKYSDGYNWRCSSCKRESVMAINYCPNCGARMDKDGDGK